MRSRARVLLGEAEQVRYIHRRHGPRYHDFKRGVQIVGGARGRRTITLSPDLVDRGGPWMVNRPRQVAQSILFARPNWTVARARAWLQRHGYQTGKVDRTRQELRFRQLAPAKIARGSFVTQRFGQGVEAVMGHTRNPAGLAIFTNPGERKGHAMARRHHKRPVPAGFASWRAYMAHIREGGKVKDRRRSKKNDPGRKVARRHARNPESRRARSLAAKLGFRRRRRGNPGGFVGELLPAFVTSLGVTGGKAVARGVIPVVFKKQPTGIMGLGSQTLVGALAAFGVHLVWPKLGRDMLVGTFQNLDESLLRTPITIGGVAKPIPFFGTALSDYREAYRLAGYARRVTNLSDYRQKQLAGAGRGASHVRGRSPITMRTAAGAGI